MTEFNLDRRLAGDCIELGAFSLCQVLLMNDSRYPWLVLVPQRPGIHELHELAAADQQRLLGETTGLSGWLQREFGADKMNIAALGNVVAQLHVHVIVRYRTDDAWPAPVWGHRPPRPYTEAGLAAMHKRLRPALAGGIDVHGN